MTPRYNTRLLRFPDDDEGIGVTVLPVAEEATSIVPEPPRSRTSPSLTNARPDIGTSTGPIPDKPAAQASEDADDKPVDFNAFRKAKGEAPIEKLKDDKVVVDNKGKVEDDKTKEVPEEEPEVKSTKKELPPTAKTFGEDDTGVEREDLQTVPESIKGKDFAGLDDTEVKFGKKMSNDAFENYKARILEVKELKKRTLELETQGTKGLPSSYYEHDQAFILDPDFQSAISTQQNASSEKSFWEQQYVSLRKGDKWKDAIYDQAAKQVKYIDHDPSADAELYVSNKLARCQSVIDQSAQEANNLTQDFKSRNARRRSELNELENHYFPQFKDPEKLKANKHFNAISNILTENKMTSVPNTMFAKLYAWALDLGEKYTKLESQQGKSSAIARQRTEAGPSNGEINSGGNGVANNQLPIEEQKVDFEMFEKKKRGEI